MERDIYKELVEWKNRKDRKPLVLNGARQIGKTYILKQFGREQYESMAYINVDKNPEIVEIFEHGYDPKRIIEGISANTDVNIQPGKTLVFLDEVQCYPKILSSLKYFQEDAPEYHIAVAGSLLGISLHQGVSFPVGKVNILQMFPMSFLEFLDATNRSNLRKLLDDRNFESLYMAKTRYEEALRTYYYVGGMPEAVLKYAEGDIPGVRSVQKELLIGYRNDFSKHAPKNDIPKINRVWDIVPSQLTNKNMKFAYSRIDKKARGEDYAQPIQWLLDAGLLYKVPKVSAIKEPLSAYEVDGAMKLFPLDVGLLGAQADVTAKDVFFKTDKFSEYKGAFTEAYCCSQLMKAGFSSYFYNKTEDGAGEIDFIITLNGNATPVEVKSEDNVFSKSLRNWLNDNPDRSAIRFSMKSFNDTEQVISVPLYAIESYLKSRGFSKDNDPGAPSESSTNKKSAEYTVVKNGAGKYNYKDKDGNLLASKWLDSAEPFRNGYAKCSRDGISFRINTEGIITEVFLNKLKL